VLRKEHALYGVKNWDMVHLEGSKVQMIPQISNDIYASDDFLQFVRIHVDATIHDRLYSSLEVFAIC
jgi:hypothetical protein